MKVSLYSNRLDNLYNQISNNNYDKISSIDFHNIKNNIESINEIYAAEDEMFNKYSKDQKFRKRIKKTNEGKAISDFLIGMKEGEKKKPVEDRKSIIKNVIERNKNDKKHKNFEQLTNELNYKYNKKDTLGKDGMSIGKSSSKSITPFSTIREYSNKSEKSKTKQKTVNIFSHTGLNFKSNKDLELVNININSNFNTIQSDNEVEPYTKSKFSNLKSELKEQPGAKLKILDKLFKKKTFQNIPTTTEEKNDDDKKVTFPSTLSEIINLNKHSKKESQVTITESETPTMSTLYGTKFSTPRRTFQSIHQTIPENENVLDENEITKKNVKTLKWTKFENKTLIKTEEPKNEKNEILNNDEVKKENFISKKSSVNFSSFSRTNTRRNTINKNESEPILKKQVSRQKTFLDVILDKLENGGLKNELLGCTSPDKEFLPSPKKSILGLFFGKRNSTIEIDKNLEKDNNSTKGIGTSSKSNLIKNIFLKSRKTKSSLIGENETAFLDQKKSQPTALPLFKTGVALNKFLIRDFLIGDTTDPGASSKKKMELTNNMFENREEKKKKKIKEERQAFEIAKYGAIIEADNSKEDNLDDYSIDWADEEKMKKSIKRLNDKVNKKIKERSKKMVEMIENISNSSYEETDIKDNIIMKTIINRKNLDRVIRVRNIVKKKMDPENDHLGFNDIDKFKEQRRENDNQLMLTLKSLGPPSFLKTRFKNTTIEKFKVVNGKYFGCYV